MSLVLVSILAVIAGIAVGIVVMTVLGKAGLDKTKNESQAVLDEAKAKAENILAKA